MFEINLSFIKKSCWWKTPTTASYIYQNPVKTKMCENTIDYKFSSARFYEELGDEFDFLIDYRERGFVKKIVDRA